MISSKSTFKNDFGKVKKAVNDATYKSIGMAAASVRLIARRSMKSKKAASSPGQPPATHTKRLPNAIVYFIDRYKAYAIVGPSRDLVGTVGSAHELGGQYKKQNYPKRPFMMPALEKAAPRMPSDWARNYK